MPQGLREYGPTADGVVLGAQPGQDRLQVAHVRPAHPIGHRQHGRRSEPGGEEAERRPTPMISTPWSAMVLSPLQDGIRMAEDQRRECRPGHADHVGEGQQPAMSYKVSRSPRSVSDTSDCDHPAIRLPNSSCESPDAARKIATTAGIPTRARQIRSPASV